VLKEIGYTTLSGLPRFSASSIIELESVLGIAKQIVIGETDTLMTLD
jgi:hypothetical protein